MARRFRRRDSVAPDLKPGCATVRGTSGVGPGLKLGTAAALAGAVLLGIVISIDACGGKPAEEPAPEAAEIPTISAETANVSRRTMLEEIIARGPIAPLPNADVKVSALVAGRVTAVSIAEGDSVREGQLIAQIDPRSLQDQRRQAAAAAQQATVQRENARLNLQRTEQMFQRGIAAGKEVEDARNEVATAEAAVEQTTANLDSVGLQLEQTRVLSPISGQVVKRMVSVGEQVDGTAAQPIAEIANLDQVEVAANVPADQIARIKVGQSAQVTTEAYPNRSFTGTVVAIAPSIDPITNAALARVRVANAGALLKVGMFAVARVEVGRHANALVVPVSALVRNEEGAALYVVNGDIAERTSVTVGLEQPDAVEILSGVTEGQTVLTSAVHGLGEKAKLAKP